MQGRLGSLLRLRGVVRYTALVFLAGVVVPAAHGQPTPDPAPGTRAVPTPDPAPLGTPTRPVTRSRPVVSNPVPVVRPPAVLAPQAAATVARHARAAPRVTRARTPAKPKVVVRSVPRDAAPVVLHSAAALVLDEPERVTTTFAVLALFAVILTSGSFLGLLVEVRRSLR